MKIINPYRFASAGATLLLDETGIGSAYAAYSVTRRLRAAYSGSALRVRRSSDDAEQDIGFTGDALDQSSLATFCGGTNGFIATLYDQSGNARDATQATTANQPQIVSSGTVLTDGGKPAMLYAGSGDCGVYYNGSAIGSFSAVTACVVCNGAATAGTNNIKYVITAGGGTTPPALRTGRFNVSGDENKHGAIKSSSATAALSAAANTNQMMGVAVINNTALSWYENNNSEVTGTSASWSSTDGDIGIGMRADAVGGSHFSYYDGYIQEAVVWLADIEASVATIKSNVNGFYSIY